MLPMLAMGSKRWGERVTPYQNSQGRLAQSTMPITPDWRRRSRLSDEISSDAHIADLVALTSVVAILVRPGDGGDKLDAVEDSMGKSVGGRVAETHLGRA